ncbi:DUF2267 domain-containing protein [Nocardiopsis sp. MG754419]|uniref:DUF2267 domain-containing protein n=1 Tax=Nocardiopsis sp. MG754419 TaxID=2259865 RepID=UPI001BA653C5|nr:DUF2267 domain-containing protein [Nocardiopsis sp. MG754419]MBR8743748.1 DUF2267 domain-containing protein [Nocardiopsis sp. MG754419]
MRYDEFLARVRDLGEHENQREAEEVTTVVLAVLATRLPAEAVESLAAQLPDPLRRALGQVERSAPETFGVEEFQSRVATLADGRAYEGERDSRAVLSTVASAVSGGELNRLLSQLPPGYAVLFGKPELA